MDDIISDFQKPSWWMTAVVMAILAGLISAYAKPWLDKLFTHILSSWRNRSESRRIAWANRVAMIAASDANRSEEIALEGRQRLNGIRCLGEAAFFLLMSFATRAGDGRPTSMISTIVFFLAVFLFFTSLLYDVSAFTTQLALREARRKTNQ